jgi:hypothetical protein
MKSFKQYLNEKWGKDTLSAIRTHYGIEKRHGNIFIHNPKISIPTVAALSGGVVAGMEHLIPDWNNVAMSSAGAAVGLLGSHMKEVAKIRKRIKANRKRLANG